MNAEMRTAILIREKEREIVCVCEREVCENNIYCCVDDARLDCVLFCT